MTACFILWVFRALFNVWNLFISDDHLHGRSHNHNHYCRFAVAMLFIIYENVLQVIIEDKLPLDHLSWVPSIYPANFKIKQYKSLSVTQQVNHEISGQTFFFVKKTQSVNQNDFAHHFVSFSWCQKLMKQLKFPVVWLAVFND